MMSSSESSSAPSPSPPASPEASFHGPPSLERLVGHFVSAKRSLSSTTHVWRANELVTNSRALIEEIAVLNAKNQFSRRGVDEQLDTLHTIRDGVADAGETGAAEFKGTIAALDKANDRLQKTLVSLRKTVVDASLQRRTAEQEDPSASVSERSQPQPESQKTLYDFIHEANHEDILSSLRSLIDSFNDARAELDDDVNRLDESLKTISDLLVEDQQRSGPKEKRTIYDEPPPSIPQLFHGMEAHATEMATLLQSLVSHYDLCVTALKHTEGGGEAAKLAIQQVEDLTSKNTPGVEESLYLKTVPEPISDEERAEMLSVLERDADQVEDVVGEIRDRSVEMETQCEQLMQHADSARATHRSLRDVLVLLHQMKDGLPSHLLAVKAFRESWQSIQLSIKTQTKDLVELTNFHSNFAMSYSKLLQEVDRRHAAETQMKKVAEKAKREMDKLYQADKAAREEFMEEVGGHLPRDIYPALADKGVRWETRPVVSHGE